MTERRNVTGYAIDAPHSKDLDDAISLKSDENGHTVTVCISDVAHAVKLNSDIDHRARERAFTRYFARGSNPMLPRRLSEHSLSLVPNEKRNVVVFELRLNLDLEVIDVKIYLGKYRSHKRLTHGQVDQMLENNGHKGHTMWMSYYKFAERLLNNRRQQGALVVYDLKRGLYANEEGSVLRKQPGLYFRPYVIVQEFMILVNHAATMHLEKHGVQLLFRNHETLANDANQQVMIQKLYGSTESLTKDVLSELADRMRRFAARARYEAERKGHFGLNLTGYAHWTSPIRRYADLVNHRQLHAWLAGGAPAYTNEQLREIGDHLNAVYDREREVTSGAHRNIAHDAVRAAGKEELLKLEEGYFSLFVRMLTDEQIPLTDQRYEVIVEKIQENVLPLVDYVRLLFTEVPDENLWRRLQENALQALVANPDALRASLNLAQQTLGWVSTTRHEQVSADRFSVSVTIARGRHAYESTACEGQGKAEAEALAIADLLRIMTKITIELPKRGKNMTIATAQSPKSRLFEECAKHKWPLPTFSHSQDGPVHQLLFTCVAELARPGEEVLRTDVCKATKKRDAERMASNALLALLNIRTVEHAPSTASVNGVAQAVTTNWESNPISALQEYVQKRGIAMPAYEDEQAGASHIPTFTVRCRVMIGESIEVFEAQGSNKKEAKRKAALLACEKVFKLVA